MIKTLVKLAIVVLFANAAYRVGSVYLDHIKFRDAIRDAAMFKARNDVELTQRIMSLAIDYDIPLSEDDFTMSRIERHVEVSGHYAKLIEIVPTFTYPWPFSWDIDVYTSPLMPPLPRQR
jgi:hypothetical protein